MLGPIFRRFAEKNSLAARDQTIQERDHTIDEQAKTINELRQRLTDHGIDPDATDG